MVDPTAPRAVFTLEAGRRAAEHIEVVSFTGHEAVSRLFAWDVVVNEPVELADALEGDVLGRPARLVIHGGEAVRCVRGIGQSIAVLNRHHRADRVYYRLRISPRLWTLTRSRNSRIFQDRTVQEIVAAVLEPYRVRNRWELHRRYAPRGYCVQHQESDLHFVRRLLAEEGIFFFFAAPPHDAPFDTDEEVVFADAARSYVPVAGDVVVPFRDPDRGHADEEFVASFSLRGRIREGEVRLREFEFRHPARMLDADTQVQESPGGTAVERAARVYDHHMEFDQDDVGVAAARVQLEQYRASRTAGHGTSWCPRFAPGHWFSLEETGLDAHNQRYALDRVEHRGVNPGVDEAERAAPGGRVVAYQNEFWCVPVKVPLRPKAVRDRVRQVLETAVVVGPAGEEIHTDPYGRIKVQFHWDLDGRYNEHSSCWIRPMQSWAGASWGFQFIPRVGMEVLVMFTGGDVDRPVVVGSAYNGANVPPFALPEQKSRSGIRTQSTVRADGYNELSFEDLAGLEQIRVRAQRDMDEEVLHDHTRSVGNDQKLRVGASQTETVGASQTLNVGVHRAIRVGAAEDHTVGGSRTVRVGGRQSTVVGGALRSEVQGDRQDQVGGAFRTRVVGNHNTEVGGNLSQRVQGDHRLEVSGRSLTSVEHDSVVSVRGDQSVVITGGQSVSVAGPSTSRGTGDVSVHTTKTMTIKADEGISLICGSSVVKITADEIQVTSKKLTLKGVDEATLRGGPKALLKLDGEAALTASTVSAKGSGSSLELGGTASLLGAAVKLGSGAGGAVQNRTRDPNAQSASREWHFTLFEPAATAGRDPVPLANVAVTATGHGPEPWSGSTDASGVVRVPVVYETCVIRLVAGHYTFDLHAGGLHGQSDPQALAREHLFNLGHGPGDVDGWDAGSLRSALGAFQSSHDLNPSGLLLDDTISTLRDKHG